MGVVGDESAIGEVLPYWERWDLSAARRFFARSSVVTAVSRLNERRDHDLCWQDVTFTVRGGVEGVATVVSPSKGEVVRGVVLAHGGSDDGRRFFVSEAADLACCGAAVILPAVRVRQDSGTDEFATDVRDAVLTERAALDVLIEWAGAPWEELSFLGHSGGGCLGAFLCAVEPRLSRIGIFGYGAGTLARSARAREVRAGRAFAGDVAAVVDWFDAARFVGVERFRRDYLYSTAAATGLSRSLRGGPCSMPPRHPSYGASTTGTTAWTPTRRPGRTEPTSSRRDLLAPMQRCYRQPP